MRISIHSLWLSSLGLVLAAPQGSREPTCSQSVTGAAPSTTVAAAQTSPTSTSSHQSGGEEYVVIFDSSQPEPAGVSDILNRLELSPEHADVHYTFSNSAFRGFAASMKTHCIDLLHNMTEVSTVEKSVKISSANTASRDGAPWGLERISSAGSVRGDPTDMDFTYTFDEDQNLGRGVDIYVVDTGVNVEHSVFGGRARMGFSFQRDASDGDGHGTHVAGTAAGSVFGVAPGANIIGVKVLGSDGAGFTSDTIAGMDYIIQQHETRKNEPGFVGSIMSMSWGLDAVSDTISRAVQAATDAGIHVSVAAGNSGQNSCGFSPAASGGSRGPAVTVGSIGIDDTISSFSNTGECNDIYAPGEDILSAWIESPKTINVLSGTSMACPHVTGVMACLMEQNPELASSPAAMKQFLRDTSLKDVIKGRADRGDPMLLLNNGIDTQTSSQQGDRTETFTPAENSDSEISRGITTDAVVANDPRSEEGGFLGLDKIVSALVGTSSTTSSKPSARWNRASTESTIRY